MPGEAEFAETKVDRELFGVFREEDPICVGDPYHEMKSKWLFLWALDAVHTTFICTSSSACCMLLACR